MCKAAPIPGETRTWQYITLFKRIFLIDCPGVVYGNVELPASASAAADSSLVALENETTAVLKGVVRIDNLEEPAQYADGVLSRVKTEYLRRTYGIASWTDSTDFLEQLARQSGRLLKGGETDVNTAARMLLNDWQRGRLPYFVCPPFEAEVQQQEQAEEAERKRREEQRRLKVEQMYSKIAVRVQFNEEDSRGPAAEQQQAELEDSATEQQPQQPVDGQQEAAGGQEEAKDWDSVYADMQGEEVDNDEAQRLLSAAQDGEEEAAEDNAKEIEEEEEIVAEVRADSKPMSRKRRALSEADAEEDEVEAEERGIESAAPAPAARAAAARLSSPQPSSNGDTRPRSKKNKSRSKKKKKEASRKAKRGRPAA